MPGEAALAGGLTAFALAIALMVKADLGISTISSLPYVLSVVLPELSFGAWNMLFQIGLLVVLVAVTRRLKTGYLASFAVAAAFGGILDVFVPLLDALPSGQGLELLYIVLSFVIMCLGISLMVASKVPLMIVDMFIIDLVTHLAVTFRRFKTLFDVACLTASVAVSLAALGGLVGVGIATVVMALLAGTGVSLVSHALRKVLVIEPWSKTLARMAR